MKLGNKLTPLYYLGQGNKKEIIYLPDGKISILLRVGTLDKFVAWEVWKYKEYGDFVPNNGDVVIDIGGHIGTFTLFISSKLKAGRVITFEPVPKNFKMIKRNLSLNNINNVVVNQQAVGSKTGESILHLDEENNGANSFYESDSDKIIKVSTTTLEEIFNRFKLKEVKLLKIDAEGAEYDILLNCKDNLLRKIKKIVIEYHDYLNSTFDYKNIIKKLSRSGFVVKNKSSLIQRVLMKSGILVAKRNEN